MAAPLSIESFTLASLPWCDFKQLCVQVEQLEWPYALPQRLSKRLQPPGTQVAPVATTFVQVPHYARPAFCEAIREDKHNAKFLEFDNHPCTYLAAGIALPATIPEVFA